VKHKNIISLLLPILFITSLMVPLLTMVSTTSTVSASPNWWNSSWTYRRAITISPLNAENSQIQINIPSDIPISDYPSIRFLENSASGVLPYWIENNDNGASWVYENVAWVRRLENDDNTIYMYYHNASVTSAENGSAVFMEFANFGDNANTYNWNVDTGSGSGATVTWLQNSVRVQQGNKTRVKFRETEGLPVSEESTARTIEFRMRDAHAYRGGLLLDGTGWNDVEYACIFDGGSPDRFWQDGNNNSSAQENTWYIATVAMWGTDGDWLTTTFYNGAANANYRTSTGVSWNKQKDWTRANGGDYVSEYDLTSWNDGDQGHNPDYYYDWFFVIQDRLDSSGNVITPVATVGAEETITRGVSVTITPATQSGTAGENLSYTVKVQNTGNFSDNFDLAFGDSLGWTMGGLPANTGVVAPGDNFSGTLWIVVAGSGGDNDNLWVQAISEGDNTKSDNKSAIAANQIVYGVQVSISPSSQYALRGDNLTYTVTVHNTGNVSDSFDLSTGDNAGWSPSLDDSTLTIAAFGSSTTTLRVTAGSTQLDSLWVEAVSVGDPGTSDNKSALADARWTYRRAITISPLNPENFQIKVVIPSVISTSDYPSIRFLENQTTGVLPYWIEKNESNYSTNMDVSWVRRLENDDNTIYMYYHNPSAVSAENGDNVFLFFTDFGTSDEDGWTAINGAGSVTWETQTVHIVGGSGDKARIEGQFSGLSGQEDWRATDKTIEVRVKNAGTYRGGLLLNGSGWSQVEYGGIYDSSGYRFYQDGGHTSPFTVEGDKYYIVRVDMFNTQILWSRFYYGNDNANYRTLLWENEKDKDWTSANGGDYVDKIVLAAWDSSSSSYYYDWLFMRKYASTTPVAGVGPAQGPGVSVSISPSSQSGANGDTLNYTVTVTNTGQAIDNFNLSFGDNAGWSPGLNNSVLTIAGGASDNTTTLSVTIPANAIGGTIDGLWVQATSQADNAQKDNESATATVTVAPSVSVSIAPSSQSGSPGDTLVYTVTVNNTGNVNDTYTLDNNDNSGWVLSLSNTSVPVPAFSSDNNTTLNVTIPGGAENNAQDNVTVTATGTSDNASASCLATSIITTFRGVSISISPPSQNGNNGDTLNYTVTVNNTGNVDDNYDLTWGDDAGWSLNVSPNPISVAASSSENATLSVTIPSNAIGGTIDNITVQAVSEDDAGVLDNQGCTAELNVITSVSVLISPSSQNGNNGDTLTYTVTVTNTGNVSDTYTLDNTDTLGWVLGLSGTSVGPLAPSASDNSTTLSVTIPSNAIGGTIDNVTVTATGSASSSASCTAQVNIARSVSVSISPGSQSGVNNATLNYTVTINNTGNVSDNYSLTPSDDAGWSPSVLPTSVVVPAFSSDNTVTLSVTVPPGAIVGTIDNITVTANGTGDNASDTCTANVIAIWTGTATFRLENLYKVSLEKDLQINTGSKLVVKFYDYSSTFENEAIIDSIAPPQSVVDNENVPHPAQGSLPVRTAVKNAELVLTTDDTNNIISTIASFTVHQSDLRSRYLTILRIWSANPTKQPAFRSELIDILKQWSGAPT
jgi:hypothetical protein